MLGLIHQQVWQKHILAKALKPGNNITKGLEHEIAAKNMEKLSTSNKEKHL